MNSLSALSVSIGVLAGLATFLAVGPLSGVFLIWAATISWAAYFALGGTDEAAKNTVVCSIFGVVVATYAAYEIATISPNTALGFPLMAAVIVTVTVIAMCLAANIPALSAIPASVLGYSATFGYLLQTPDKLSTDVLLGAGWDNPVLIISCSLIIGVGLGIASAKLAAKLTTIEE
ncbi:hypothetical protein BPLS_P0147 [Bathymodiolus platifrons methanotrophic gill symbiont]|uniref:DUF1097 domain-containing protein n=1 Tax=Bathymodiolus platifrons methanotrophic gill symbiont TaxID=113268 RepID=UPI0011C96650|nr:DUF1097 domain-containing protein [Bathymodiolus platifrons methanotrophic gill symbiont]TXL01555.1 hypothetical protein BMR02_03160 [Methylococcaceae bacterium HT1]TXL16414.1 hypothetical protein BMR04_10180 [Methylococcaceae bacterium HT3]TXL23135.1 hypothetical protein BMR03_04450 [Methylococcaceae bacterium HT2]GFO73845.1 hypothetical protein BPLS_P0147 [Bathymodiolus platifrons methanotrophic gill symbiont]